MSFWTRTMSTPALIAFARDVDGAVAAGSATVDGLAARFVHEVR